MLTFARGMWIATAVATGVGGVYVAYESLAEAGASRWLHLGLAVVLVLVAAMCIGACWWTGRRRGDSAGQAHEEAVWAPVVGLVFGVVGLCAALAGIWLALS